MEAVTGQPWNQVVSEQIRKKDSMGNDALVALSPSAKYLGVAYFLASCGILCVMVCSTRQAARSWPRRESCRKVLKSIYEAVHSDIYLRGDHEPTMVRRFATTGAPIGNAYQWDVVFENGDIHKPGICGQAFYISPQTDTAVIYFSTTWQSSQAMVPYTRGIVKQIFRKK